MANDADLFGDSSSDADTDDLIAAAKSQPIAKKKGGEETKKKAPAAAKKKDVPDADNDPDSDDDFATTDLKDSDNEKDDAAGLFDSSSEDEAGGSGGIAKKKKKLGKKQRKPKQDKRSKKERMEALAKKRHVGGGETETGREPRKKRAKPDKGAGGEKAKDGNESEDTYNSAEFQRTKDDDDFIDAEDEDPDALKELYAEQHFDDERGESDSEDEKAKKKKAKGSKNSSGGGVDKINLDDDDIGDENADATSALVMAVKRMAKKKKETKKLPELEMEATEFLKDMDAAADADDENIKNRKPATKKLTMLPKVLEMLARKDLQRSFLDLDLLGVLKRWVQPLPSGSLGNVTLRKAIFDAISSMTGENGVNSSDLKRSGFGKVTMALYMHKDETPQMKKLLKSLIDQWSRPIFQKSGDMRDLEKIQARRSMNEALSRPGASKSPGNAKRGKTEDELAQIISEGSKNTRESGNNRVRVPYSKGFQFTVRPTNRTGDVSDKRNLVSASGRQSMGPDGEKRNAISKRMLEKNRPMNKQKLRSANISIEGRASKG